MINLEKLGEIIKWSWVLQNVHEFGKLYQGFKISSINLKNVYGIEIKFMVLRNVCKFENVNGFT